MVPRSNSLPLDNPYPLPAGEVVPFEGNSVAHADTKVTFEEGAMKIEQDDGSVVIDFSGGTKGDQGKGHDANLAISMEEEDLADVASQLMEGITRDDDSRREWLETRARGIELLGLKIEKSRSDAAGSAAPLEGMSVVRHPLLLEATVSFQATARAELLPATGPVKVRNDMPMAPTRELVEQNYQASTAKREVLDSLQANDDLADALEKGMNHYLTVTASEYVPDTDRMLFYIGFGGDGFKKVYNCPLRQRPVSESVDAEDLIVSNAATDLGNCSRITHRIKMRPSVLKRMQIVGAYRDVDLNPPSAPQQTIVEKKKEEISGVTSANRRPEDHDFEVYECYCELDLDQYAPKQFKGKGLPLPYRVTIEKESKQILDLRRNWEEDDENCIARRFFVQYPFIRGLGFYGLGYIHLLGNTTAMLTAAWRLMADNGMFANFPGFLYAKGAGRQNTNQLRVPPGGGVGVDVGAQKSIKDAILPLPYRDIGAGFATFISHVEEIGQRMSSTANIGVGEGKQEAPVGTTLALIEQATKVIDSAHKRLHASQNEEFQLLKQRFREDPEAFWRHNKNATKKWEKDQFLEALNRCNIVPVADPNNPTALHRLAKAMAIKTLQQDSPALYDPVAVDMRVMRTADIDPTGLFNPSPPPPPPDPRIEAIKAKAAAEQGKNQIAALNAQIKQETARQNFASKAEERQSRERIAGLKHQVDMLKAQQEGEIRQAEAEQAMQIDQQMANNKLQLQEHEGRAKLAVKAQEAHVKLASDSIMARHEAESQRQAQHDEIERERERHQAEMDRAREKHAQDLAHARERHAAELEAAKAMSKVKAAEARAIAKAKPKPAAKKPSGGK